jgi:hypothetical protein
MMSFGDIHNCEEAGKVLWYIRTYHKNLNSIRGELEAIKADGSKICVSSDSMDYEGLETWVLYHVQFCTKVLVTVDVD